jgi:hypothetical protein
VVAAFRPRMRDICSARWDMGALVMMGEVAEIRAILREAARWRELGPRNVDKAQRQARCGVVVCPATVATSSQAGRPRRPTRRIFFARPTAKSQIPNPKPQATSNKPQHPQRLQRLRRALLHPPPRPEQPPRHVFEAVAAAPIGPDCVCSAHIDRREARAASSSV